MTKLLFLDMLQALKEQYEKERDFLTLTDWMFNNIDYLTLSEELRYFFFEYLKESYWQGDEEYITDFLAKGYIELISSEDIEKYWEKVKWFTWMYTTKIPYDLWRAWKLKSYKKITEVKDFFNTCLVWFSDNYKTFYPLFNNKEKVIELLDILDKQDKIEEKWIKWFWIFAKHTIHVCWWISPFFTNTIRTFIFNYIEKTYWHDTNQKFWLHWFKKGDEIKKNLDLLLKDMKL